MTFPLLIDRRHIGADIPGRLKMGQSWSMIWKSVSGFPKRPCSEKNP
jgi:hypothetical protein